MNTSHTTTFDPVFRCWLVQGGDGPALIIKTGFLKSVGTPDWPLQLHSFLVYDGHHKLLGTLEPRKPLPGGARTFLFHRHSRNDDLVMPGAYVDMDGVIADLLAMGAELARE